MARYYFTVQYMSPNSQVVPRYSPRGTWLPPKALGNNERRGDPILFEHDGQTTTPIASLPDDLTPYKTYSLYYSSGLVFVVPYDATALQVHDGEEHPSEDGDDDDESVEYRYDWSEVKFGRPPRNTSYLSFARPGLEFPTLLVQRNNQRWAHYFLPDRYQAVPRTNNQNYGGLVGDLPLLLALVAMSMPPARLRQELPQIIRNPWQIPHAVEARVPRASEWTNTRGLVVTVLFDEEETSIEDLQDYEQGNHGAILP